MDKKEFVKESFKKILRADREGVEINSTTMAYGLPDLSLYVEDTEKGKRIVALNWLYAGLSFVVNPDGVITFEDGDRTYVIPDNEMGKLIWDAYVLRIKLFELQVQS